MHGQCSTRQTWGYGILALRGLFTSFRNIPVFTLYYRPSQDLIHSVEAEHLGPNDSSGMLENQNHAVWCFVANEYTQ